MRTILALALTIFLPAISMADELLNASIIWNLDNGTKYVQEVKDNHFVIPEDDEISIRAYVEPRTVVRSLVTSRLPINASQFRTVCDGIDSKKLVLKANDSGVSLTKPPSSGLVRCRFILEPERPIDITTYPYLKMFFSLRPINTPLDVRINFDMDTDRDDVPDESMSEELYISEKEEKYILLPSEKIDFAPEAFRPKSYHYNISRELGLSFDDKWHYKQYDSMCAIRRRFRLPLKDAARMNFYLSAETSLEKIDMGIDINGNGRRDLYIGFDDMVKRTKIENGLKMVTIDLIQTAKKLHIDIMSTDLLEVIVRVKDNIETIIAERKIKGIEFYGRYYIENNGYDKLPWYSNLKRDREHIQLEFSLWDYLKSKNKQVGDLRRIDFDIGFTSFDEVSLRMDTFEFFDYSKEDFPAFAEKADSVLQTFFVFPHLAYEYIKSFRILWWENLGYRQLLRNDIGSYDERLIVNKNERKQGMSFKFSKRHHILERDFYNKITAPSYLVAEYEGEAVLQAEIVYKTTHGEKKVLKVDLIDNKPVLLPLSKGEILLRINIYADPIWQVVKKDVPRIWVGELFIVEVDVRTAYLMDSDYNESNFWHENNINLPLFVMDEHQKKLTLYKSGDGNLIVLLSDVLPDCMGYEIDIPSFINKEAIGNVLVKRDKKAYWCSFSDKGNLIRCFLDSSRSNKSMNMNSHAHDNTVFPSNIFLKDSSLRGFKCLVESAAVVQSEYNKLISIDKWSINLNIGHKRDTIDGIWLTNDGVKLAKGSHEIKSASSPFFVVKNIVIEPKKVYSLTEIPEVKNSAEARNKGNLLYKWCLVFLAGGVLYLSWQRYFQKKIILSALFKKLTTCYKFLSDKMCSVIWLTLGISLYIAGLKQKEKSLSGENYWWIFGEVAFVIFIFHLLRLIKAPFEKRYPRIAAYVYRSKGTPYISSFIVIFTVSAFFLLFELRLLAEQVAFIAYYLLFIGIIAETIAFIKKERN